MYPIKKTFGVLFTILTLFTSVAQARTIYYGSETEMLSIAYGGPTLLRFPAEVRTISQASRFEIAPADPEQPNYTLLSVTPRFTTGTTDVVFLLADGSTVKTRMMVVPKAIPEKTDAIYEFKSRDAQLPGGGEGKTGADIPAIDLMRAMIRGDEVAGYDVRNLVRTIHPGFAGVETRLVRIYTGNQFNGYIFELENTTKRKLFVNIQNLQLGDPNLALLSSVDRPVIERSDSGYEKTYLRIVAKPSSIYSEIQLPIQTVERKGDK